MSFHAQRNFDLDRASASPNVIADRRARGTKNYVAGHAAEAQVAHQYLRNGATLLAENYRAKSGEIDLILRDETGLRFVEVKRSSTFDQAAFSMSERQYRRIFSAANEYLGGLPNGLDTIAQIDLALVDATGQIEIIENIIIH